MKESLNAGSACTESFVSKKFLARASGQLKYLRSDRLNAVSIPVPDTIDKWLPSICCFARAMFYQSLCFSLVRFVSSLSITLRLSKRYLDPFNRPYKRALPSESKVWLILFEVSIDFIASVMVTK